MSRGLCFVPFLTVKFQPGMNAWTISREVRDLMNRECEQCLAQLSLRNCGWNLEELALQRVLVRQVFAHLGLNIAQHLADEWASQLLESSLEDGLQNVDRNRAKLEQLGLNRVQTPYGNCIYLRWNRFMSLQSTTTFFAL